MYRCIVKEYKTYLIFHMIQSRSYNNFTLPGFSFRVTLPFRKLILRRRTSKVFLYVHSRLECRPSYDSPEVKRNQMKTS